MRNNKFHNKAEPKIAAGNSQGCDAGNTGRTAGCDPRAECEAAPSEGGIQCSCLPPLTSVITLSHICMSANAHAHLCTYTDTHTPLQKMDVFIDKMHVRLHPHMPAHTGALTPHKSTRPHNRMHTSSPGTPPPPAPIAIPCAYICLYACKLAHIHACMPARVCTSTAVCAHAHTSAGVPACVPTRMPARTHVNR